MDVDQSTIRIGELLIKAGFLTTRDFNEAHEIALASSQKVGQVLVMSGFITDHQLNASLRAQERLRAKEISLDMALKTLALCQKLNISFDDAFIQCQV